MGKNPEYTRFFDDMPSSLLTVTSAWLVNVIKRITIKAFQQIVLFIS